MVSPPRNASSRRAARILLSSAIGTRDPDLAAREPVRGPQQGTASARPDRDRREVLAQCGRAHALGARPADRGGRWRARPRKGEAPWKASDRTMEAEDFAIRVRNAFQDGRDPRTVVTAEDCGSVAAIEWGSLTGPGITPGNTSCPADAALERMATRRVRQGRAVLEPAGGGA